MTLEYRNTSPPYSLVRWNAWKSHRYPFSLQRACAEALLHPRWYMLGMTFESESNATRALRSLFDMAAQ